MNGASVKEGLIRRTTDVHCNNHLPELQTRCDRSQTHSKIKGKDSNGLKTSQSAVYTQSFCEKIFGAAERLRSKPNGRRIVVRHEFMQATESKEQIEQVMSELHTLAEKRSMAVEWEQMVTPWVKLQSNLVLREHEPLHVVYEQSPKTQRLTTPHCDAIRQQRGSVVKNTNQNATTSSTQWPGMTKQLFNMINLEMAFNTICKISVHRDDGGLASGATSCPKTLVAASTSSTVQDKTVQDLITTELVEDPWQYVPYKKGSATWQAAGQRRHQHKRRTNTLLGVASVDLSGPHVATPMLGATLGQASGPDKGPSQGARQSRTR